MHWMAMPWGVKGGKWGSFPPHVSLPSQNIFEVPPTQPMFQSAFKTNNNTDWITEKFIPEQGSEQVL